MPEGGADGLFAAMIGVRNRTWWTAAGAAEVKRGDARRRGRGFNWRLHKLELKLSRSRGSCVLTADRERSVQSESHTEMFTDSSALRCYFDRMSQVNPVGGGGTAVCTE